MSANTVDREKEIVGWIIICLSAAVAVLLYVRDIHEAVVGCLVPASYGFTFVWEARKKKEPVETKPRLIGPVQWLLIVVCLAAGFSIAYFAR